MKKDDKVTIVVKSPWSTTEEEGVIEKITKKEIFIVGLKNPFNKDTGIKVDSFPGTKVYIKELVK